MTEPAFTCQQIVELVTEYLDNGLETSERLAFERHVAICPPCRGHFAQLRKLTRTSGGLHEEDLPPKLREDLMVSFREWKNARSGT
jgi:anti-sigma factor RsiW